MCGRYNFLADPEEWKGYELDEPLPTSARYNIAPSQLIPVIGLKADGTRRGCILMKWGFVPRWAKAPNAGPRPINARCETITTNPAFRDAIRVRRCLVPASGFYEWDRHRERGAHGGKQAQHSALQAIHFQPIPRPIAFAGIWDVWRGSGSEPPLYTCAIITTAANACVQPFHPRMPAILTREQFARWLNPHEPLDRIVSLLQPFPAEWLRADRVGPAVNSVRYDGPACLQPARPTALCTLPLNELPFQDGSSSTRDDTHAMDPIKRDESEDETTS